MVISVKLVKGESMNNFLKSAIEEFSLEMKLLRNSSKHLHHLPVQALAFHEHGTSQKRYLDDKFYEKNKFK